MTSKLKSCERSAITSSFKLVGEDLRDFKREMTDCHSVTNGHSAIVNPNATVFYLWTALGAARFAKSFLLQKKFKAIIIALRRTIKNALLRKRICILATRRFKVKF